jgi:hypothetical protein
MFLASRRLRLGATRPVVLSFRNASETWDGGETVFVTSDIFDLKRIGRFRDFEWREHLLCGVA